MPKWKAAGLDMSSVSSGKPEFLYKFRALDNASANYTLDILRKNSLWLSKPLNFNDPFDCVPVVSTSATDDKFRDYVNGLFKKFNPAMSRNERRVMISEIMNDPNRRHDSYFIQSAMKKSVDEAVNSAGVLSLTSRFDHVLMWSHYASSHSGICLKFRLRPESWITSARKVLYSADRPIMNIISEPSEEIQRKSILFKADFWAYEDEWRVINPALGAGSHDFDPNDLVGIIFGKNISADHKSEIIKLASKYGKNFELIQASIDDVHYRLNFDPI
ncbi:DUF2971 domain-containing protein [Methylobacterium sp. 1973]|uniref:DUF2971 domain-containing protein n=1 Tax=Methylobacterium sp. 1973 TaxID=3156421 RepID=UPI003399DDD2